MNARETDIFAKRFGEEVKRMRKEQGLSHEALANQSGVTRPTIANIESCIKAPTITTCYKIAKSLGIRLSDLIKQAE